MSGSFPSLLQEQLNIIYAQARAEFPNECCGYVLGRGASARVVPCENRQDKLHALDPIAYPRTSAHAYSIAGRELLTLTKSIHSEDPATMIYHSHPRVGAYFSEEDALAARAADLPVDYLVVDVQETTIAGSVLFRRAGDTFVEVERFAGANV